MLIDADSNTETGYRGADYDYYLEIVGGKAILIFIYFHQQVGTD